MIKQTPASETMMQDDKGRLPQVPEGRLDLQSIGRPLRVFGVCEKLPSTPSCSYVHAARTLWDP